MSLKPGTWLIGRGEYLGAVGGGNISPGSDSLLTGTGAARLTIGSLNATDSGDGDQFVVDLNGTEAGVSYDQLLVMGAADLANRQLIVRLGYTPHIGDRFDIVQSSFVDPSSRFIGLPNGAIFTADDTQFRILYGFGASLTVVPEPSAPTAVAAAAMFWTARRRVRVTRSAAGARRAWLGNYVDGSARRPVS